MAVLFRVLQMGGVSRVVPIDKFSVVITVVLAFLVLGETATLKVIIGTVFITIGMILMVV